MQTAADVELLRVRNAILKEFPEFRLVKKRGHWLLTLINFFLKVVTFGRMSDFLSRYTTTIGYTIYAGDAFFDASAQQQASILRHEAVHMRQRRRLGQLRFSLIYLFWPFPVLFAKGRRDLEMEAYEETLKAYFEYYDEFIAIDTGVRARIIGEFLGAGYLWMWPWREDIEDWYAAVIQRLLEENRKTRKADGQNQA